MTMLTAADVAKHLNLSARKVYELAASQRLASHRFGGAIRFTQEDVAAYVESCRVAARHPVATSRGKPPTVSLKTTPIQSELEAYFAARRVKLREKPPKR